MTGHFDVSTLNWVKGEIDETLKQARITLEKYAENPDDEAQVHFCSVHLHQVAGTLEMVELFGAALFAAEMERLADSLPKQNPREPALEVLMRTILLLPDYLEVLQNGQPDSPMILLPLINELRRTRGEAELSAAAVFQPLLTVEPPAASGVTDPGELAHKLRPHYQAALVNILRGADVAPGAKIVAAVFEKLRNGSASQALRRVFWVGGALAEALREGGLPIDLPVKQLLGKFDQIIKQMGAAGDPNLEPPALEMLLRAALYELGRATSAGRQVTEVRRAFRLDALLPSPEVLDQIRSGMGGFNAELKKTVSRDVMEELSRIKDVLDLFSRNPGRPSRDLKPISAALGHISDVLGLLRETALGDKLREQVAQIDEVVTREASAEESLLMGVAESVLSVEGALSDWGAIGPMEGADDEAGQIAPENATPEAEAEHRRIIRQVMKEAKDDLVKAREAISAYVQRPGDNSLADVPRVLKQIIGSLSMLSYRRVAQVLRACRGFVEQQLVGRDKLPSASELDSLADAMMSVEYYLDAFVESRVHPSSVLDVAEKAVARLGYPVDGLEEEGPDTIVLAPPGDAPSEEIDFEEFIAPESEAAELDIVLQPALREPAPAPSAPPAAPVVEVDEEILEIFAEEAEEELQKIGELLPRWQSNTSDREALGDLRRSFHTLKGSGRLVGAKVLGEFAWAFESLLNRVIDGTIQPGPAVFELIEEARLDLPELLQHFRGGAAPSRDFLGLQEAAFALAQPGERPAAVAAPVQAVVETSPEFGISDPVLREIYTKEAEGHVESLKAFVASCRAARCRVNDLLVRALHTLCGSSRTAGVASVAEVASLLEKYAKVCQSSGIPVDAPALNLLADTAAYVGSVIKSLREGTSAGAPGDLPARAAQLLEDAESSARKAAEQKENPPDSVDAPELYALGGGEGEGAAEPGLLLSDALFLEPSLQEGAQLMDFARESPSVEEPHVEFELLDEASLREDLHTEGPATASESDPLAGISFLEELSPELGAGDKAPGEGFLQSVEPAFDLTENTFFLDERDLGGSLESQEAVSLEAEVSGPSAVFLLDETGAYEATAGEEARDSVQPLDMGSAHDDGHFQEKREEPSHAEATALAIGAVKPEHAYESPDVLEVFAKEAADLLTAGGDLLQEWKERPQDRRPAESLQRLLHTLKGSARWAGVSPMADLGHALESTYAAVVAGHLGADATVQPLAQAAHAHLRTLLNELNGGDPVTGTDEIIARLKELGSAPAACPAVTQPVRDYDPELLSIFLEEGQELLNACDESLQAWIATPQNKRIVENLQRHLHTLKGGARMAGVSEIGDLGHSLESMLAGVADGIVSVSPGMLSLLQRSQDRLAVMLEQLRHNDPLPGGDDLVAEIEALVSGKEPEPPRPAIDISPVEPTGSSPVISVEEALGAPISETHMPAVAIAAEGEAESHERRQGGRAQYELVRVRSDLLDSMVNVAGEASIFRSRVEQQIGEFRSNLSELNQIIDRLRERLRLFDIETEAQIQSRYEEAATQGYEDFDPLEFDRFTNMQQFSRSMVESLGDLGSVGGALQGLTRETETLLVQQARVNTELQEGLMHTRMVPLVQHAPRLRRIVRQTCDAMGKEAELRFQGAEVEMDRNVVERIMAPLEHLLRNAVAHGIESPAVRESRGKPRSGTIVVNQVREGTEVVVRVIDDGGGINIAAVREKAVARGLMERGAHLSDAEILHFILESGFSTAESLTQIAGRGVGMDVVNSEVKNLNGTLSIESEPGKGTTFTIRLPMTLTVSRALLVYAGDDMYAVPLLSIEGIVRASDEEIAEMLVADPPVYRWLGNDYDVMHLATVLGIDSGAAKDAEGRRQSVLLAHSGDHRVALVVDGLFGSREIVVKPVGRQLGSLRGLSGATILGDGRVALILELPGLIRMGLARRSEHAQAAELDSSATSAKPTIMVVDDSITVRKVTSRLLERNEMNSVSAKDGMEAVSMLQEIIPDVMLLDIEMPRMDGYELATHVRNEPRLRDVPIIMITSRSGEKHRQRAIQIGVNVYMTKPFQESELLENIRTLLRERRPRAAKVARVTP